MCFIYPCRLVSYPRISDTLTVTAGHSEEYQFFRPNRVRTCSVEVTTACVQSPTSSPLFSKLPYSSRQRLFYHTRRHFSSVFSKSLPFFIENFSCISPNFLCILHKTGDFRPNLPKIYHYNITQNLKLIECTRNYLRPLFHEHVNVRCCDEKAAVGGVLGDGGEHGYRGNADCRDRNAERFP